MITSKPDNTDEYIAGFPDDVQKLLQQVRNTIKKTVPEAVETISYGMPAFKLNGHYVVYFAAYKKHISIYPVPGENTVFEKEFAPYKTSGKGTVQFPPDKPLPLDLIKKIVQFNIKRNEVQALKKKTANAKK